MATLAEKPADKVSAADFAYFNGENVKIETASSVLVSSSPYLNHPMLRQLVAQEVLRRNGKDLQSTAYIPEVAQIIHQIEDTPAVDALFARERTLNPDFAAWLDRRHLSNFTVDDVTGFAPGTLGATIHDFLTGSGYQIDYFFQGLVVKTDYDYYKKERVFTHDIEHMVTGLETDFASETGLIWANMESYYKTFSTELAAELTRFYSWLATKSNFKTNLYYPKVMPAYLESIRLGIEMGRAWKKPLLMVPWRDHLDWTISQIREEYNIIGAPPSGHWAWTTAASRD